MARILPVVLAASVAAHVTRAANQCTCMGPCEKRPIPFVHPRPERRWCYTSGECGQWSVLRWAYWDWCDTNPPGMVDNPALCGPRYGTCGNYCGGGWCAGRCQAEAECFARNNTTPKPKPLTCSDACCMKHDACCGETTHYTDCNTAFERCLQSCDVCSDCQQWGVCMRELFDSSGWCSEMPDTHYVVAIAECLASAIAEEARGTVKRGECVENRALLLLHGNGI